jgi:hypothetical protein
MTDEIIKELWQIKDEIGRKYGYDIDKFIKYLQTVKHKGKHQVVDLSIKKKAAEQGN